MKKTALIIVFFLVMAAVPVLAKSLSPKKSEAPPELVIPEKECQYLMAYEPADDVEYQPGLDVHGKPVLEADLTPPVIQPPEKYSFDITVDVAKYMGLTIPMGVAGEVKTGTITVEKGRVAFNGTPLEGDAEAALKEICSAQQDKKTPK